MSNQQHTFESISNFNEKHDLENSLHSLENAINFIGTSKSDIDLKNFKIEKFFELERDYRTNLLIYDYEKAIISLKKMIFFDKKSNNFILNIDPKYFAELAKCYIKLHDISSAISCYKKSLLFDNNNKFYSAALEKLLFAKGMISLSEEGKINSDLLNQIKNDMSRTHFHYLK
jgi:tetratricopeptide (TPR) repeat protein